MAQSRTPYLQTDETKRFNLDFDFQSRDGTLTKDSLLENVMVSYLDGHNEYDKRTAISPRPGLTTSALTSVTGSEARGLYYWERGGMFVWVVDNHIYSSAIPGIPIGSTFTSSGSVGWAEFQYSTGVVHLILSDGTYLYKIDYGAGVTQITTCPVHNPSPVFLDGYLFLSLPNKADIWNCNLDDPTTWSGAFITAEMYPDSVIALTKNNNYLYAVGVDSIEFFYDAGNALGTPLQRYPSAVLQFGTDWPLSVVSTESEVFLAGSTGDGEPSVWMISGFKETEIATPAVKKFIAAQATGTGWNRIHGSSTRINGEKVYMIYFLGGTLVYTISTKQWTIWTSNTGISKAGFFPYWIAGTTAFSTVALLPNGKLVSLSTSAFTDYNGTTTIPFECNIITPPMDFGIFNRKRMSCFKLIGGDTGAYNNTFNISWNDSDYSSSAWTTPRTMSFAYDFPAIPQLGNFRRRAIKINCLPTSGFRLEAAEVDISKGNQ